MGQEVGISPIRLVGAEAIVLSADELRSFPLETIEVEVNCASGNRYMAAWRGIPIVELLKTIATPSQTSHIIFESADGHQSCVDVAAALDGLVAFFRDGKPLSDCADYDSRFVAPSVDGARMTKAIREIRATCLSPESNPSSNENISNDPTFGNDC